MPAPSSPERDLSAFVLPEIGKLHETGDPLERYRLMDPAGSPVEPVAVYFKDLPAGHTPATTLRS